MTSIKKGGATKLPPRIVITGPEKAGKTTFASQFPSPIIVTTEDGCSQIEGHLPQCYWLL